MANHKIIKGGMPTAKWRKFSKYNLPETGVAHLFYVNYGGIFTFDVGLYLGNVRGVPEFRLSGLESGNFDVKLFAEIKHIDNNKLKIKE